MHDANAQSAVVASQPGVDHAVVFEDVWKTYRLYENLTDQAVDVLGLSKMFFWRGIQYRETVALKALSLAIPHGQRVGIVGANGAGKSTMLKLVTKNFSPTRGEIRINGTVQALMHVGLGFHPEFTGFENIRSSLLYNGLSGDAFEEALADIVDFVELDGYLDQPVRTYSLGMRTRLQFAAATAISPDILIVDEVLGAGDAYFAAKSADRMERLTRSGCTLLLVSHSMQQILQFCERVIWLREGEIQSDGRAVDVVRAYEEHSHNRGVASAKRRASSQRSYTGGQKWHKERDAELMGLSGDETPKSAPTEAPDAEVSRWEGTGDLRISKFRILNQRGKEAEMLEFNRACSFEVEVQAQSNGEFTCQYLILIFTADGKPLIRYLSDQYVYSLGSGDTQMARLEVDSLLLGNGVYVISVAIFPNFDPAVRSSNQWYDLLSRTFEFEVTGSPRWDPSLFFHPGRWQPDVAMAGDPGN